MFMRRQKSKSLSEKYQKVAPGIWRLKVIFVNVYIIADKNTNSWVLVDAGLKGFTKRIIKMADTIFGKGSKPSCIVLTHGHFDHRGCLEALLKIWDVPVYVHKKELPYLTGLSSYPPADPLVGGGVMALSSPLYPKGPINLGDKVKVITDCQILQLPEWKVIETPGHSPGHISLFREEDKVLIAGDAFVTTKQESAFYALSQKKRLSGPPKYFTPDWTSAHKSVEKLALLQPRTAATGHGQPMYGKELQVQLTALAANFEKLAVPAFGRYVNDPVITNENGTVTLPQRSVTYKAITASLAIVTLGTIALSFFFTRKFHIG